MPGIALFVDLKADTAASSRKLSDMLALISREDWHVTRKVEEPPLFLGRVDLEGEVESHPLWVEEGDTHLTLLGHFDLDDVERRKLSEEVGSASPLDDSRLALRLYQAKGLKLLDVVRGIFAVIIWHSAEKKLVVANDRLGYHHIFFSTGEGIAVCSEAKGVAFASGRPPALDLGGVGDLINFGYVLGDKTLYQGVRILPTGCILTWCEGKWDIQNYWRFLFEDGAPLRPQEELAKLLAGLLKRSSARLSSLPSPPVVTLSGGLDCRMIAASLPRELPGVKAITWGKPGSTDAKLAARVAVLFGFSHSVHPTPETEFLDRFKKVVEISDGLFVGEASVRNINLEADRKSGRSFTFGHNVLGYYKPTPPGLDDTHLAEDTLRAQPRENVSRFVRPEWQASVLESRHESVKEVLSRPLPDDYVARHQLMDELEFRRRFHFMALIVMRNAVDVRLPLCSYDIMDIVGGIAPSQRADRAFYMRSLFHLSPEASRIPYANTGFPPGLPFWLQRVLIMGTRGKRNLLYRLQRVTHVPTLNTSVQPDAHWVRLYMTDGNLMARVRELLLSPDSRSREYLLPDGVERHLNELKAGLHRHTFTSSIFLTLELALRRFFS